MSALHPNTLDAKHFTKQFNTSHRELGDKNSFESPAAHTNTITIFPHFNSQSIANSFVLILLYTRGYNYILLKKALRTRRHSVNDQEKLYVSICDDNDPLSIQQRITATKRKFKKKSTMNLPLYTRHCIYAKPAHIVISKFDVFTPETMLLFVKPTPLKIYSSPRAAHCCFFF